MPAQNKKEENIHGIRMKSTWF